MSQSNKVLCSPITKASARVIAIVMTLLLALVLFKVTASATVVYKISDGEQQYEVETNATELTDVLDEAGVAHSDIDLVDSARGTDDVVSVSITRRQYVTVVCDGVTTSLLAGTKETVADVLSHLNITLGEFDEVSAPLDSALDNQTVTIDVYRATVTTEVEDTPIPYESIRTASTELPRGEEAITTEGVDGNTRRTYRIVEVEGKEPTRELISTDVTDPVTEVLSYGTKTQFSKPTNGLSTSSEYITNIDDELGTITTSEGNTYRLKKKLTLNATAYTDHPGALCSTGRIARIGVVAIDPKYIPYGTEMFIMSEDGSFVYGYAIAGDCGGAIDDNDVDLYMSTESICRTFGRRNVVGYIIESIDD